MSDSIIGGESAVSQTEIHKKYKKYIIPAKKKTFNQICFPKAYELQIPQEFLSNFINPRTQYKGILIYHKIGAGKTCTAIRIAEEWKHERKIIALLPAALKSNFKKEIISQCTTDTYISNKDRKLLATLHPTDQKYIDIENEAYKKVEKHYTILSYNKFIELYKNKEISLKNTLLIVDEIQNMVSEDGTYYNILYDAISNAPSSLRIVLMSATPMFDKPMEIALTMNLLRLPESLPVGNDFIKKYIKTYPSGKTEVQNMDDFKNKIRGFISYYRGAPDYVFPDLKIKYVRCVMSRFQYDAYKLVKSQEHATHKSITTTGISSLPSTFYLGTRYISNVVFPNGKINDKGFKSFVNIKKNIGKYSCKFEQIIRKLNKSGKSFIYSGFKEYGGLKALIHVLEEFGYKNYKEHGEGRKRFAIWSSDQNDDYKNEVRSIFNMKQNLDGSRLKIILGSPSIKEGVSFTAVKYVHILEPYWNNQRMLQIIGRASRFCSHKDLPEDERTTKVCIYLAVHPNEKETIDEFIYNLSKQKTKIINEFEKAIREAAVDCTLFRNANGKDISCDL